MIKTELRDVVFTAKGESVSLSSLGLHVEKNGLASIFQLPTYSNINTVDWQEYDGLDVNFASASMNPIPLSVKVFGRSEDIDTLVATIRTMSKQDDILVGIKIDEANFNNEIAFSTKFDKAVKSRLVIENEHQLEYYLLTDDGERHILTEDEREIMVGIMEKKWRNIAFATITLSRCNNVADFGLLADNTRRCQGVPNVTFTDEEYPNTNMPVCFKRYHVEEREATEVDSFQLYDSLVYCYPLKGIMQGLNGIEESKTPYVVKTENMIGQSMHTRNADKRKGKSISIPLLVRSHSVSAIFLYLGKLKNYIHTTLTSGDMLYLCSEKAGDYAVYPTEYSVTRAFINDQPWVEMTVTMMAYKRGFDFTATTDGEANDNPEPPLPPAPPVDFDPYNGIDKTAWMVCDVSRLFPWQTDLTTRKMLVVNPRDSDKPFLYNFDTSVNYGGQTGWSTCKRNINAFPVGTLFFADKNFIMKKQSYSNQYMDEIHAMVCMPFGFGLNKYGRSQLEDALKQYKNWAREKVYEKFELTLVGVAQGCNVDPNSIKQWSSQLQDAPRYGGIVGAGEVRVHSSVMRFVNNQDAGFHVISSLRLTTSDDFDDLVDNIIKDFEDNPHESEYYTNIGYQNTRK